MSRRASGVAVVVLAAFGAAALVVARGADEGGHAPAPAPTELEAIAGVAPRVALFGDTIEATLDVIVDPERVDPARSASRSSSRRGAPSPRRGVLAATARRRRTYGSRSFCAA